MSKQILLTSLSFALALLMGSCTGEKKERPSPLVSDSTSISGTHLKIEFGSPSVRERNIWGGLIPFNELWRTGANEATRFTTTERVRINGMKLDSGTYALLSIPGETTWEIILNEDHEQWGTYDYDSTLDVLRLNVIPKVTSEYSEKMKFYFEQDSLKFHWVNLGFSLSLE